MKLWAKDDAGVHRFLGIPVGTPWDRDPEIVLRCFEPENPAWFVPRTMGIGWDLNLGAVAVKLGAIRPDDSLPDLEAYIPAKTRRFLKIAPWVGTASACAISAMLANKPQVTIKWSASGLPKRTAHGKTVAALTSGASIVITALPAILSRIKAQLTADDNTQLYWGSVDAVSSAQILGIQTLICLTCGAAYWETQRPGSRQLLAIAAALSAPAVAGGVLVGVVKSGLDGVAHNIASGNATRESHNEQL